MDLNIPLLSPDGIKHDDRFHFGPVYQFASVSSSSSSSSPSSRINLFTTTECYRPQLYGPSHHEVDKNYGDDLMEDDKVKGGIKLKLWKSEDEIRSRKPKKMKKREQPYSCSSESDMSSNKSSFPIRVCADCSTTKTPLWRSGPNGPKSLCNACGIRQRKARRAMAGDERPLKMKEKEKKTKMKKVGSGHKGWEKKGRLEQVLMKVSNSLLGVQRVFPQDERDAAILLMTLSSSA